MKILAIDTSCDDTSVAISDDLRILSNVFWSKMKLHESFGGVVPSEARRQHNEFLPLVMDKVFKESELNIRDIDYIAVTQGPGLAIALESGISYAVQLAKKNNKKLVAVNHMIGHIYANLCRDINNSPLSDIDDFKFPLIALTISGGHTDLYLMKGHLDFEFIGGTLDDAVGESFDKVGRMLGMGFPAGAKIENAAKEGNKERFSFPVPLANSEKIEWSFSGLKTSVLYQILKLTGAYESKPSKGTYKLSDFSDKLSETDKNDISYAFQYSVIKALVSKMEKAINIYKPSMIVIGGGVIANSYIRGQFQKLADTYDVKLIYPKPLWLCTDNAAMISSAAYFYINRGYVLKDPTILDRVPSLGIKDNLIN